MFQHEGTLLSVTCSTRVLLYPVSEPRVRHLDRGEQLLAACTSDCVTHRLPLLLVLCQGPKDTSLLPRVHAALD